MHLLAAALAASAPAPAEPVQVVTRAVTLARHDAVPVRVRCARRSRSCRGLLVLGLEGCSGSPVAERDCQRVLGTERFAIPPRSTRIVVVGRSPAAEQRVESPDTVTAVATPYLGLRALARTTRRTRTVRIVAPPGLRRPGAATALRSVTRVRIGRDALRLAAAVPRGTTRVEVEIAGRTIVLHPEGFDPYLVGRTSFAAGGVLWHGEQDVGDTELRTGERRTAALRTCGAGGCATRAFDVTIERDRSSDPQPICRLRPLTAAM